MAVHTRNGPVNQLFHLTGGAGIAAVKPFRGHHILGQSCQLQIRLDALIQPMGASYAFVPMFLLCALETVSPKQNKIIENHFILRASDEDFVH